VEANAEQLIAPEAVEAIAEIEFDQTANLTAEAGHDRLGAGAGAGADADADAEPIPEQEFPLCRERTQSTGKNQNSWRRTAMLLGTVLCNCYSRGQRPQLQQLLSL
jgi:hypothetical protein